MPSSEEILDIVNREQITTIRFIYLGNDGIIRAKAAHADYLQSHIEKGIGLTKAMQSFNALDQLVSGGFGPHSSEFRILPKLETFAITPYAPKNARFIGELYNLDFTPSDTDARYFLRRVIKQVEEEGFKPIAACEAEFYLFKRKDGEIIPQNREKCFATHGYDLANELIQEWIDSLVKMNVKVERIIKEYGPAQYEVAVRFTDALKAADDMVTLREVIKGVAARHGFSTTFMPKAFPGLAGSGMHLHISLWDSEGKRNLFYAKDDMRGYNVSKTGYFFINGLLDHMKALSPIVCPLSNSYKRLLVGSWAPSHVCYGFDNRAVAIRIPSQSARSKGESTRIEFRMPDPSSNPYLAIGVTLAAGLDGIRRKVEPGEPLNVDYPEIEKEAEWLPRTLGEALKEMKYDAFMRATLGDTLFQEYINVRESEWKVYREHVSEWEVNNFIDTF
jgi:glutamine synthetase